MPKNVSAASVLHLAHCKLLLLIDMYNNIFSEKVLYHVLISIVVAIYSGTPEKMKQNQKKSNPNSNYLPYIGSINLFFSYQNRLHFDRIYVQ